MDKNDFVKVICLQMLYTGSTMSAAVADLANYKIDTPLDILKSIKDKVFPEDEDQYIYRPQL